MKRIVEQSTSSGPWNKQYLLTMFLDCAFSLACAKECKDQQDRVRESYSTIYITNCKQDKRFQAILTKSNEFFTFYHNTEVSLEGADTVEIHKKALGVLVFAFEAALMTKDWSKAQELMEVLDLSIPQYPC